MVHGIEAVTTKAVTLALDAASLRHQAIANNIANANTPGYIPMRVSFEEQLSAAREALGGARPLDLGALDGVQPAIERDWSLGAENAVAVDMEVAKMTENSVHYLALLKGLGKQYSIISAAISGGKS